MDANFFEKAARHNPARFEAIAARATALGQPDLVSTARRVSLEQYLGRLYFEMVNSSSETDVAHYYRLVRFYAAELLTTTNWSGPSRDTNQGLASDARQHREAFHCYVQP